MSGRIKKALIIALGSLCVGSIVSYLLLANPLLSARLNNMVYDTWLTHRTQAPLHPTPAVINIDEASLKKLGQLPWPRPILADLVDMLLNSGVAAIGLDIWLTEPDRSSPIVVDGLLEKNFELNLDLSNIPLAAQDNDRYFRDAIAGKPVVLGAFASVGKEAQLPEAMPASPAIVEKALGDAPLPRETIARTKGLVSPLPAFVGVAPVGILNVYTDPDGIVRSLPMLTRVEGHIYPSLALRTVMTALGEDTLELVSAMDGLDRIKVGELEIPVEKDGSFRAVYHGPRQTVPFYSALDILDGKVGRKELEGRIVFVGPSTHTLQNLRSTPFDPEVPDTEVHATVANNILTGESVHRPGYARAMLAATTYLSALLSVSTFSLLTLPVYAATACALLVLYIGGSWLLFQNGLLLSPVGPVLAMFLAGVIIIPYRYWRAQAERRKLQLAFGRYVSPEVVSKIVTEGDKLLKGEQKEATIMFTDVRGFTTIAEKLEPPQLVRLLNCYFTPMTACVIARHGTLDKFIGDALMAFWNAPVNIPDHALQAVLAALDMQTALARLRPALRREFGVNMKMGIGINTGPVHIGNMGSNDLLDYTCIGDNVNLASRLEGMCKRYGVGIVVSAAVRDACLPAIQFLHLDRISVKGSERPLNIYSPLMPQAELDAAVSAQWDSALDAYFSGNFEEAETAFSALEEYPYLRHACLLFISRCQDMRKKAVAEWDGIWRYQEK